MKLNEIFNDNSLDENLSLSFKNKNWGVDSFSDSPIERRRTLSSLYKECCLYKNSSAVRKIWNEEIKGEIPKDLPSIFGRDGFLRMYAEAIAINVGFFRRIWRRVIHEDVESSLNPIFIGETVDASSYFDVDATPPGFLPKISSTFRLKEDPKLLEQIQEDLIRVSKVDDHEKRKFLTLAILSHGVSYREMEGKILRIPSFTTQEAQLVPYCFQQHLIWEGVKTISVFPVIREDRERSIYLCQGTEIWPSQPSMLGSIFSNLGKEGSATEPYAHSWRGIHKHLRELTKPLPPFVAGHSMGGALAAQIALYSHPLIEKAFCFNPPAPEKRDYDFYHTLSKEVQEKLQVYVAIDDLPFWRIGSKIIGNVTCFLGENRWKYRPLEKWEVLTIIPAFIKTILNMKNALPAHQKLVPLLESYIYFTLSQKEIEEENCERMQRFDHINFFPKLYRPAKAWLKIVRKYFGWQLYDEYLKSQIEIIELHEADLKESYSKEGNDEILQQIEELRRQKEAYIQQLIKRR